MVDFSQKKSYDLINFWRFVCALLVVANHTLSREENLGYFIVITSRIAVPFFFICSGYFLSNKLYDNNRDIRKKYIYKYIKNIFSIYFIWSLIYLVTRYIGYSGNINIIKEVILCIRDFLFVGIKVHLWYLSALCISVYLLYKLIDKYKLEYKYIFIIAILLYLFSLSADSYNGLFAGTIYGKFIDVYIYIFGEVWNSYAQGLIFIVMGIGIQKFDLVNKISRPIIIVTASYVLFILECYILKYLGISRDDNTSLFLLILSPFIFISLLKFESQYHIKYINKKSGFYKSSSLIIYLVHPLIIVIIEKLFRVLGINDLQYISYLIFIVVSLISLSVAIIEQKYKTSKLANKISYVKKYS